MFQRIALAGFCSLALGVTAALATSADDFETALKTAEAHAKEAATNKNQWPATGAALAAAQKAAAAGNYDQALALAKEADALAAASLYQSTTEAKRWKDAEIR